LVNTLNSKVNYVWVEKLPNYWVNVVRSADNYFGIWEITSKMLLTLITNWLEVPKISYLAILANYVPKAFGSIFKIDPPDAKLNLPSYFKLQRSPFKLKILTETLFVFAKSAAF
jgi:hypothetical protein